MTTNIKSTLPSLLTSGLCVLAILVLFLFTLLDAKASSHNESSDESMASLVSIEEPWARATFALAKTGAAYMSITNNSKTEVVLSSVSVSDNIAMTTELHHTVMEDNMMQMQELEDGIKIKVNATVELSPGGMHIMIMGLTGPLNKGESISIDLHFADGSSLTKVFPILDKRN